MKCLRCLFSYTTENTRFCRPCFCRQDSSAVFASTMYFELLTLSVGFLLFWSLRSWIRYLWARHKKQLPDGPFPLPVVGSALSVDARNGPFRTFEEWALKYGGVYSVMMGNDVAVVIADVDLLRKAFKDERFSGRAGSYFFDLWVSMGFPLGIAEAEGDVWKEHRRFSLHALRDFGFGRPAGEEYIQKEAGALVKTISDHGGQPMDNRVPFATAASNVTAFMLFGKKFSASDPRFLQYIEAESENFKDFANASILDMFPYLIHVPPMRGWAKKLLRRFELQVELLHELISEHQHSFDAQNPRDYIDAFLAEKEKGKSHGQLMSNIVDLFAASFETTTTFLRWAMLYMMNYPDVQEKVQEELDRVVGPAVLEFGDRTRLPFTEATILEIFRCSNYIPFLLPHKTMEDVDFEGYRLPKDTTVLGLSWFVNRDPKLWKDVSQFRPERFLDSDGQVDQAAAANILPFSTGKRSCPGEPLARMEVLLLFGTILQKFTIKGETSEKLPQDPVNGLTLTPEPYRMCAFARL